MRDKDQYLTELETWAIQAARFIDEVVRDACEASGKNNACQDGASLVADLYAIIERQNPTASKQKQKPLLGEPCDACNGTGRDPMSDIVNWLPCKTCNGTGLSLGVPSYLKPQAE